MKTCVFDLEQWKDIIISDDERWVPGYEGLYSVTCNGMVFSYHRGFKSEKMQYEDSRGRGYMVVGFYKAPSKPKLFKIHRLVAMCWLKTWDEKLQVNHIDGNPKNNDISNLEMCTGSQNIQHAHKTGLIKIPKWQDAHGVKLTNSIVLGIRQDYIEGILNQRQIGLKWQVCYKQVNAIVLNKCWKGLWP